MEENSFLNIKNFIKPLGLEIVKIYPEMISLKFIEDKEIELAERNFFKVMKNDNSTDNDYIEAWELRHKYEKKFFPRLIPLIEKIDDFYLNRSTEYPYQIYLSCKYIPELEITCNTDIINNTLDKEEFIKNVSKEFIDFDKFVEFQ